VPATWWINGELVVDGPPRVAVDDHGLVVGDGVFETIKATASVGATESMPFALQRHLDRLRFSADGLGLELPYSDAVLADAVTATLLASGHRECRVRITVTSGSGALASARGEGPATVTVGVERLPPRAAHAAVCIVPWCRNERGATAGLKTISYAENVIALARARSEGADEAVFANTVGRLCEGTGSNVFVVVGDRAFTPPLSSGCLAGVTRALVLEQGSAEERELPLEALVDAEEAFLTSTTRDVQPIASVDGRRLPRVGGPATEAAARAFADLAAATSAP
jgi:branched-chain amino acid aminotransferase